MVDLCGGNAWILMKIRLSLPHGYMHARTCQDALISRCHGEADLWPRSCHNHHMDGWVTARRKWAFFWITVTWVHPRRKSLNGILSHGQKTILAPFLLPYNLYFTCATQFIEFASNSRLELNMWMKHTNAAPVVNLYPHVFNSQRSQLTSSRAIANLLVAPWLLILHLRFASQMSISSAFG